MTDWNTGETDQQKAYIDYWNKGGGRQFVPQVVVNTGETHAVARVQLARTITEEERIKLKGAILQLSP